jgi:hypothetical protein
MIVFLENERFLRTDGGGSVTPLTTPALVIAAATHAPSLLRVDAGSVNLKTHDSGLRATVEVILDGYLGHPLTKLYGDLLDPDSLIAAVLKKFYQQEETS